MNVIRPSTTFEEAVIAIAKGNPGALTAAIRLLKEDDGLGFVYLCHADDMGIRGPSLWIAYNDFAKKDLQVLKEALLSRDQNLLDLLRKEGYPAVP